MLRKFVCLLGLVLLDGGAACTQALDVFAGNSFVHTCPSAELSSFPAKGGAASVALNFADSTGIVPRS